MAGRIVLAAALAAVLMFLWGFVFWGLSGAATMMMSPLPATTQADVAAVLRRDKLPSGMYAYPMPANPGDEAAQATNAQQFREGPRFQLAHRLEGAEPMAVATMGAGFGHMFVVALVAATLTAFALPALESFGARIAFVLLASLLGALWSHPGDVVWWFHSPIYGAGQLVYGMVSGLLMALPIAAIVRPSLRGFAKSGF